MTADKQLTQKEIAVEIAKTIDALHKQCLTFPPFVQVVPLHAELMTGLDQARNAALRFVDFVKG